MEEIKDPKQAQFLACRKEAQSIVMPRRPPKEVMSTATEDDVYLEEVIARIAPPLKRRMLTKDDIVPLTRKTVDGVNKLVAEKKRSRKKKTKVQMLQDSRARLLELKFDPIEKLVKVYRKTQMHIIWLESLRDGTCPSPGNNKFSQMALNEAMGLLKGISNDLLRYGYGRVPEVTTVQVTDVPRLKITLTTPENFEAASESNSDDE